MSSRPPLHVERENRPSTNAPRCLSILFLFLSGLLLGAHPTTAAEQDQDRFAVLTGYGQSFPGWGQTTQRVETIDLVPRYHHRLTGETGSGWYRGYHSILFELPLHVVVSPGTSTMIGVNFLACYTFTSQSEYRPYIFGGGGPVYSFADIPGMGAEINGNYQFGAGLAYDLDSRHDLLLEFRYHHISNAGIEDPNDPLNSCKLLLGISF